MEYVRGFNNIYVQVVRLLYTNSGVGLLALGSNAIQRLWKWSRNEQNPSGKVYITFCWFFYVNQVCGIIFFHSIKQATAGVVPHHWQPNSGLVMTNDTADTNPEEAVPCIALSKNDSYVMSACGGKVSLFNMMTFKVTFNYFIRMQFSGIKKIYSCIFCAGDDNIHATSTSINIFSVSPSRQ